MMGLYGVKKNTSNPEGLEMLERCVSEPNIYLIK